MLPVLASLLVAACVLDLPAGPGKTGGATGDGASGTDAQAKGPISGLILDATGKPASGVSVRVYLANANTLIGGSGAALIGASGGALVGGSGGALVGKSGGGLIGGAGGAYRLQGALAEVRTDKRGRFALAVGEPGAYNIEAVHTETSKGWKRAVEFSGAGAQTDVGALSLGPTGTIAGQVRASDPRVTDFTGTRAYIPGSSYVAEVDAAGAFTISNVPSGEFDLGACSDNLGDGRLAQPIKIRPSQITTAPPVVPTTDRPKWRACPGSATEIPQTTAPSAPH